MNMSVGDTAQFFLGTTVGLGVVFAALLASTASIRAGRSWDAHNLGRAAAFASFAGISGIAALGGLVYGLVLIAWHSPVAI